MRKRHDLEPQKLQPQTLRHNADCFRGLRGDWASQARTRIAIGAPQLQGGILDLRRSAFAWTRPLRPVRQLAVQIAVSAVARDGTDGVQWCIISGVTAERYHIQDGIHEPSVVWRQQLHRRNDVHAVALVIAVAKRPVEGYLDSFFQKCTTKERKKKNSRE